jgi:hypothetical protein
VATQKENQIELNLEDAQPTEIDVPAEETSNEVEVVGNDEFKQAESATQKRIDKLTKKMRVAEREREEALRYAQHVKSENDQYKTRLSSLDVNYVKEYGNRVDTEIANAEESLKSALDLGNNEAAVKAQKKLSDLAIQKDRVYQAQAQQQRTYRQPQQNYVQQPQPQPQATTAKPDPKAEDWAEKNKWFGDDEAMTYAAFGIHKKLVEDDGFDPKSDDYYTELDKRIAEEFPHKFNNSGAATRKPAQTVASVSRSTSGRNAGKKVRLTPSQVAISKKLGVPLEEYAKYVKE